MASEKIHVFHLKTGWQDPDFEKKIQETIDAHADLSYYDIKISSKDNNCLVILKGTEE